MDQNEHLAAMFMTIARRAQAVLLADAPVPDKDPDWSWQAMATRFDLVDSPGSRPDLLVRNRHDPEWCLLFTVGMATSPGIRHWLAPGMARGPARRVGPGRPRARAFQAVMGGRRWGGVVVDVRGYPELRTLQVALAYRWLRREEAARAIFVRLLALHLRRGDDARADANYVAELLVRWAAQGEHLAALPLTRRYLILLAKGDRLAALPDIEIDNPAPRGGWRSERDRLTDDHTVQGAQATSAGAVRAPALRSIRRLSRQLRARDDAQWTAEIERAGDGVAISAEEERRSDLARAEAILIARATLRHRRLATKAYVGEHVGARAVERFFERHATDPDFEARLSAYVRKRAPA